MVEAAEQVYRYRSASTAARIEGSLQVALATSGGEAAHPYFFEGWVSHPRQNAELLLEVARVSRTRFYTPTSMIAAELRAADPVVTSHGDCLRFEAFSACGGVYARADLNEGSIDEGTTGVGTTNVDFNAEMRQVLAGVGEHDPMHLAVGQDEVAVQTFDGTAIERRVRLPDRWLKGFAEVQMAQSEMELRLDLGAAEAQQFLNSLPKAKSRQVLRAVPSGRGLRLTTQRSPGGVALAGPERLRSLAALARVCRRLRCYASRGEDSTASAWELVGDDASLFMVLSPDVSRGFAGEGKVLHELSRGRDEVIEDLRPHLHHQSGVDGDQLVKESGAVLTASDALATLGAAGLVGYDLARGGFFHRELPYDRTLVDKLHPRLAEAHALVERGAVGLDGPGAWVASGDVTYRVDQTPDGDGRCTCPWYARHQGDRGPCKHILAAGLVRQR